MACVCGGTFRESERELPDGSDGFRDLLEASVFGTLQEFRNIQKDDEAALEFADSGHVTGLAIGKNGSWGFDFRRRNFEHFGSGVDDQSDKLVFKLHDENAVLFVGLNFRLAKTLAQVNHRNILPRRFMTPSIRSGALGTAVISGTRTISRTEPMRTPYVSLPIRKPTT